MGWADSEDFATSPGVSGMERKALFPFWDQTDIARRVNISEDQKKELTKSYTKTLKAVEKSKSDARMAAIDLQAEMHKGDPSISDVEKYSDQISDALKEKRRAVASHAAFVKRTLNDQQELDLTTAGREWSQKISPEMDNLRRSIESSMRDGGGADDMDALFEASNVPVQFRDRMFDDSTRRMERGQSWRGNDDRDNRSDTSPAYRPGVRSNDATRMGNRIDPANRSEMGRPSTTPTPLPTLAPGQTPRPNRAR
jgi:molecular chaperone GrpE (heat shock protein)